MPEVVCPNCGHRNSPGSNFCSSCGQGLLDAEQDRPTITLQLESVATGEEVAVNLGDIPAGGALVVTRGPNAGARFALDKDVVTAGRHPDSDIFLDDITVSRRHAEIRREPGRVVVRDVGSLNGTYLNRERIDEHEIVGGDELQVGKFKLVFVAGTEQK